MPEASERGAQMVETHIAARGIRDRNVPDAMCKVPRAASVSLGSEVFAYHDEPLPIGHDETISQP